MKYTVVKAFAGASLGKVDVGQIIDGADVDPKWLDFLKMKGWVEPILNPWAHVYFDTAGKKIIEEDEQSFPLAEAMMKTKTFDPEAGLPTKGLQEIFVGEDSVWKDKTVVWGSEKGVTVNVDPDLQANQMKRVTKDGKSITVTMAHTERGSTSEATVDYDDDAPFGRV